MSRHIPGDNCNAENKPPKCNSPSVTRRLDLKQLAELVAHGEIPIPTDLAANELQTLVTNVRTIRRRQLLSYVARVIATDIHKARAAHKDNDHAQTTVQSSSAAPVYRIPPDEQ
jgi:hypothetical protein